MICVTLATVANAQGLLPVGNTNPGRIVADAVGQNQLYVISVNQSNYYELWAWDGEVWTEHGLIKNFPSHGTNANGEFEVKDAIWYNKELYILGDYYINTSGNQSDLVYKWDGKDWVDISNITINKSNSLLKFVIFKNELLLSGVFEDQNCNLLKWDDNAWVATGGWLTFNLNKDYLLDIKATKNVLYASGRFSKMVGSDIFYTGVFDGKSWTSITHPPFINGSNLFTEHQDQLILTGTPNKTSDFVKTFNGAGWDDLSSGLNLFEINKYWDVASVGNRLFISGDFRNKTTGDKFNILVLDKSGWSSIRWDYSTKPFRLTNYKDELFVVGDFNLYGINNIARLSSGFAVLNGKVFIDKDRNCNFSSGDLPIDAQVIILNPGEHVFWSDKDGNFSIPVESGNYEITLPSLIKYQNDCKTKLTASVDVAGNYQVDNFALQFKPNVVDLKVTNGFINGYKFTSTGINQGKFVIQNNGTELVKEARFTLKMSDIFNPVTFSPNYDYNEGNQYVWIIKDLEVDESFQIDMEGRLKMGLSKADFNLSYTAATISPQQDAYTDDNHNDLEFIEVNNLEPIWKQCGNGSYFNEQNDLSYYIRFANVGKGLVEKVVVRDTIDEDVFVGRRGVVITTSHKYKYKYDAVLNGNNYRYTWTWTFDEINLPDSSAGGNSNVGYVKFDIALTAGRHPWGTVVCNDAEVIYDQQEPYVTNEVCSESRNLSSPSILTLTSIQIYPNPSESFINLKNTSGESYNLSVLNTNGQEIYNTKIAGFEQKIIDTRVWAKGVYFVKIDGFECRKLIIQ